MEEGGYRLTCEASSWLGNPYTQYMFIEHLPCARNCAVEAMEAN